MGRNGFFVQNKCIHYLGQVMQKCVLFHMRTTKVQISLRIVVLCLDSMICILAVSKVLRFWLVSVAKQAVLNLAWSKIPLDQFSRDVARLEPFNNYKPGEKKK